MDEEDEFGFMAPCWRQLEMAHAFIDKVGNMATSYQVAVTWHFGLDYSVKSLSMPSILPCLKGDNTPECSRACCPLPCRISFGT